MKNIMKTSAELLKAASEMNCKHIPCPERYLQWHAWAEEKSKTHKQIQCPHCGTWAIWVKRQQISGDEGKYEIFRIFAKSKN